MNLSDQEIQQLLALRGRVAKLEEKEKELRELSHNVLAIPALKFKASDGVRVDVIRDEDDMASDDVYALATQQSVKAYADTKMSASSGVLTGDMDGGGYDIADVAIKANQYEPRCFGESDDGTAQWIKLCSLSFTSAYKYVNASFLLVSRYASQFLRLNFQSGATYNAVFYESFERELIQRDVKGSTKTRGMCYTEKDTGAAYNVEVWVETDAWDAWNVVPIWTDYADFEDVTMDWDVTVSASKPAIGASYDDVTDIALSLPTYMESGTYTGDGSEDKTVTLADANLIIKMLTIWNKAGDGGTAAQYITSDLYCDDDADGLALVHGASTLEGIDNRIKSVGTGNFHVDDDGADAYPNGNGVVYYYIAIGTH